MVLLLYFVTVLMIPVISAEALKLREAIKMSLGGQCFSLLARIDQKENWKLIFSSWCDGAVFLMMMIPCLQKLKWELKCIQGLHRLHGSVCTKELVQESKTKISPRLSKIQLWLEQTHCHFFQHLKIVNTSLNIGKIMQKMH